VSDDVEQVEGVEEPADGGVGHLNPVYFRALVAAIEEQVALRNEVNQRIRDFRAGAKDRGINMKALSELLKRRAMDSRTRDDFDESLAIYEAVAGLTPGLIAGGELRAQPQRVLTGATGAKGRALQEALAWAGCGGSVALSVPSPANQPGDTVVTE
jgi:uncharacterized protein (UPF0335 family)